MERIEHLKKYLLAVHPVRRSAGEKAEFRKWLLGELRRTGWRGAEETYGKFNGSVNVVSAGGEFSAQPAGADASAVRDLSRGAPGPRGLRSGKQI